MRKSLMKRWMLGALSAVSVLLAIFVLICLWLVRAAYYRSAEGTLYSRALSISEMIGVYVADLSADYDAAGRELVEQFEEKSRMELQILGKNGEILFSSTGFWPADRTADEFAQTIGADGASHGLFRGAATSGENVMAVSVPVRDGAGEIIGGVRCVASLEQLDRQVLLLLVALLLFAGLILLAVLLFSSWFLRSVLVPLREVDTAARRMALGDYEHRIVKHRDDEIGRLSDTINYMASEISAGERVKNEFITSVSHELRTPLTAIRGWSETLRQAGPADAELLEQGLDVIADESARLDGLVEQLLDFSRMQSGRFALKKGRVDLQRELEEVVFLMRERARREGIELEYVKSDALPALYADADRLRQVFVNLIDNAVKYSGAGGRIRVEAAQLGRRVQVVVSDTGVGIAPEHLPHIRERFYRVSHSRPGSGIGLSVVDEIVRAHGGDMKIESTLGVGTTVTVTLPMAEE